MQHANHCKALARRVIKRRSSLAVQLCATDPLLQKGLLAQAGSVASAMPCSKLEVGDERVDVLAGLQGLHQRRDVVAMKQGALGKSRQKCSPGIRLLGNAQQELVLGRALALWKRFIVEGEAAVQAEQVVPETFYSPNLFMEFCRQALSRSTMDPGAARQETGAVP